MKQKSITTSDFLIKLFEKDKNKSSYINTLLEKNKKDLHVAHEKNNQHNKQNIFDQKRIKKNKSIDFSKYEEKVEKNSHLIVTPHEKKPIENFLTYLDITEYHPNLELSENLNINEIIFPLNNRLYFNNSISYQFTSIFTSKLNNQNLTKQAKTQPERLEDNEIKPFQQEINKILTEHQFFINKEESPNENQVKACSETLAHTSKNDKKCIIIHLYRCFLHEENIKSSKKQKEQIVLLQDRVEEQKYCEIFAKYLYLFLSYGKSIWSIASIQKNKRFDLLSLKFEAVILWKGKSAGLTRTTITKKKILQKLLQCAAQREKTIGQHETIIKIQFSNQNIIYLTLSQAIKESNNDSFPISNSELMINQQIFHNNLQKISQIKVISVLSNNEGPNHRRCTQHPRFQKKDEELLVKILSHLHIKRHKLDHNKKQTQNYLVSIIQQLNNELHSKREELKVYKHKNHIEDNLHPNSCASTKIKISDILHEISQRDDDSDQEQFTIPSERIHSGRERFQHLQRQIKREEKSDI